jgi:hypothetical protein
MVRNTIGCMIVPLFAVTPLNPLTREQIPITEALLYIENIMYIHLMAKYRYHTEATIEYMKYSLEEVHCHTNLFSQFHTSKSKKQIAEAFEK